MFGDGCWGGRRFITRSKLKGCQLAIHILVLLLKLLKFMFCFYCLPSFLFGGCLMRLASAALGFVLLVM